jgi:Fe2+ transport system protein FeoA
MFLSELTLGKIAVITRINCTNTFKNRLADIGVIEGCEVKVLRVAPLKDPIEIKVKSFRLAIRKNDAKKIEVSCYD